MVRTLGAAGFLIASAVLAYGQMTPRQLEESVDETVSVRQKTQRIQDEWADERTLLQSRLRAAEAAIEHLTRRKAFEERRLAASEERVGELRRRLEESTRLQSCLQDTLNAMFFRLERWLDQDLPFLFEERSSRLELLRGELARPDISGAEKLRRLLEAFQIEAAYGGSVAVEQGRILLAGQSRLVDMLRVGRLCLFWRTTDGAQVGIFDPATREWVELPGEYRRGISMAMDMASRLQPPEVLTLPIGRIQP